MSDAGAPVMPGKEEWREGWRVVVSAFFGASLASTVFFSHGVFMKPLQAEFDWTRTEVAMAAMIFSTSGALMMTMIGHIIARFGTRRVVLVGWVLAISAFAALSQIDGNLLSFYALWIIIGLTVSTSGAVTLSASVVTWFVQHRGAAVSIALTGTNAVGALIPVVSATLISDLGWRNAYLVLASVGFVICYPLLVLWFFQKPVINLQSSRAVASDKAHSGPELANLQDLNLGQALRAPAMWIFASSLALGAGGLVSQVVHFVPLLTDHGASPELAAAILSLYGLVAIVVGFAGGFVIDRLGVRLVALTISGLPAGAALALLVSDASLVGAGVASMVLGIYAGAIMPTMSLFVARYFGVRHYSKIFAILMAMFTVAQGLGAVIVGAVHDISGSYSPALVGIAVTGLAGALLMTTVGKPRLVNAEDEA